MSDPVWRCEMTNNPVGTDTVMVGAEPCGCQGCRAFAETNRLKAALRRVVDTSHGAGSEHWEACSNARAVLAGFGRAENDVEVAALGIMNATRSLYGLDNLESIYAPQVSTQHRLTAMRQAEFALAAIGREVHQ